MTKTMNGRLEAFEQWYGTSAPQNENHDLMKTSFFAGWHAANITDTKCIFGFLIMNFQEKRYEWTFRNFHFEDIVLSNTSLSELVFKSDLAIVHGGHGLFFTLKDRGFNIKSFEEAMNYDFTPRATKRLMEQTL